mmetsp:Transcript_102222/g.329802  ORF Transcript_102222/g.329802 Transcript_102222/m.329802 type:complete len:238 (+) Transcript_102222:841-1554(+)
MSKRRCLPCVLLYSSLPESRSPSSGVSQPRRNLRSPRLPCSAPRPNRSSKRRARRSPSASWACKLTSRSKSSLLGSVSEPESEKLAPAKGFSKGQFLGQSKGFSKGQSLGQSKRSSPSDLPPKTGNHARSHPSDLARRRRAPFVPPLLLSRDRSAASQATFSAGRSRVSTGERRGLGLPRLQPLHGTTTPALDVEGQARDPGRRVLGIVAGHARSKRAHQRVSFTSASWILPTDGIA